MSKTKTQHLYRTDPHGAHNLLHVINTGDCTEPPVTDPNAILALQSGTQEIGFTGEELTNLSRQWLKISAKLPNAGVVLVMPSETWDLLYETLSMDAESAAFDKALRADISNALSTIHELNPHNAT